MIDFNNLDDVLMWDNYRLVYYRQRHDMASLKKTLDDGSSRFSSKPTPEEQLAFRISELRMR